MNAVYLEVTCKNLSNERKISEDLALAADSVSHISQRSQKAHFKWSILFFKHCYAAYTGLAKTKLESISGNIPYRHCVSSWMN